MLLEVLVEQLRKQCRAHTGLQLLLQLVYVLSPGGSKRPLQGLKGRGGGGGGGGGDKWTLRAK